MLVNKNLSLLYGILLGDGCLCKHVNKSGRKYYFISITGNYYDDKPFYNLIVVPLLNRLRINKKQVRFKDRKKYGKIEITISDKVLFNQLNEIGFPIGKKGPDLEIPKIFYKKDLLKYIVQGFFATDGSLVLTKNPNKFYPRIESRTIHKILIKQIHEYLLSIGMNGSHYFCLSRPDPRWKVVQDQYRFQFNGKKNLILFEEKVGFINPKQCKKFLDFIEYDAHYNKSIKGIPSSKQRTIRDPINLKFMEKMALRGI